MSLARTSLPRLVAALLTVSLLATACGDDTTEASDTADTDGPAADNVAGLTSTTFDGDPASFDDLIGTPIVVNFFAEWCVNCITEMPEFEMVARELAGDVRFVGISIDQASEKALELVEATGVWSGVLSADTLRETINEGIL